MKKRRNWPQRDPNFHTSILMISHCMLNSKNMIHWGPTGSGFHSYSVKYRTVKRESPSQSCPATAGYRQFPTIRIWVADLKQKISDLEISQPPSQALVSVFMQVPNWDISLANATESLAQNICRQHSHRDIWSQLRKSEYKVQPPCRSYEVER